MPQDSTPRIFAVAAANRADGGPEEPDFLFDAALQLR
jgi:hypothetical protein